MLLINKQVVMAKRNVCNNKLTKPFLYGGKPNGSWMIIKNAIIILWQISGFGPHIIDRKFDLLCIFIKVTKSAASYANPYVLVNVFKTKKRCVFISFRI